MTRKYQVFISSSFIDLKEARSELILATLRDGHIPAGMELFKPGPNPGLGVIETEIKNSDIFVVLVGARLGTRAGDRTDSLAFTQMEYDLAVKYKKPIISFLLNDHDYLEARKNALKAHDGRKDIITSRQKRSKIEDNLKKLEQFREEVQRRPDGTSRIVGFFALGDLGKLCEDYSRAIADYVNQIKLEGEHGGWVMGSLFDDLNSRIMLDISVSDNPFFRTLARQLDKFGTLAKRTTLRETLKEGAARYFWQRYFAKLYLNRISYLFFESGSSIAYVSREFINSVRSQEWFNKMKMNEKLHLRTNNLLTYLEFLLQDPPWPPMDVRLQPQAPFSQDYGGTYGILNSAVQEAPPGPKDAVRTRLPKATQNLVDTVIEEFKPTFSSNGLVLMTASGLDRRPKSSAAPYPGPHVGSYPNMLMKRSLLALSCPKVLFIDPAKWNLNFRFSNCHSVCDRSFPWEKLKSSSPLALALAADTKIDQGHLANELRKHGFGELDLEEVPAGRTGPWSIIAANRLFANFFQVKSS